MHRNRTNAVLILCFCIAIVGCSITDKQAIATSQANAATNSAEAASPQKKVEKLIHFEMPSEAFQKHLVEKGDGNLQFQNSVKIPTQEGLAEFCLYRMSMGNSRDPEDVLFLRDEHNEYFVFTKQDLEILSMRPEPLSLQDGWAVELETNKGNLRIYKDYSKTANKQNRVFMIAPYATPSANCEECIDEERAVELTDFGLKPID